MVDSILMHYDVDQDGYLPYYEYRPLISDLVHPLQVLVEKYGPNSKKEDGDSDEDDDDEDWYY